MIKLHSTKVGIIIYLNCLNLLFFPFIFPSFFKSICHWMLIIVDGRYYILKLFVTMTIEIEIKIRMEFLKLLELL